MVIIVGLPVKYALTMYIDIILFGWTNATLKKLCSQSIATCVICMVNCFYTNQLYVGVDDQYKS